MCLVGPSGLRCPLDAGSQERLERGTMELLASGELEVVRLDKTTEGRVEPEQKMSGGKTKKASSGALREVKDSLHWTWGMKDGFEGQEYCGGG